MKPTPFEYQIPVTYYDIDSFHKSVQEIQFLRDSTGAKAGKGANIG